MSLSDDGSAASGDSFDDFGPPTIGLDEEDASHLPFQRKTPPAPSAPRPGPTFRPPPVPGGPATLFGVPTPPPLPKPKPAAGVPTLYPSADDSMPGIAEFDLAGLDSPSVDHSDLDLPEPVMGQGGIDLPAPVVAPVPELDFDLPVPVVGLNLPTPVQPLREVPRPAGYLGMPMDPSGLDLPVPVDLDLPTPVELDLPIPVQTDLLQPAHMEMEPAHMDVEPATTGLQPAYMGMEPAHAELRPADLDLEPVGQGLRPVGARPGQAAVASSPAAAAAAAAASVGTDRALPAPTRTPSPANKMDPRVGPSRGLMIALGGIVVVGLAGAGVMYSGILDPVDDPQPASLSGPKGKAGPAVGPAVERSADVLAKLAQDTPAAYRQAMALAEEGGDAAGAAEAALALVFRYGPEPEVATKGAQLLKPYATQKDAFVQRVVGLAALVGGQTEQAESSLVGDDSRTRLYRGWLRLSQDRASDALAEAEAVVAASPDDRGALCLQLAALAQTDPAKAAPAAEAALGAHPEHPGVQQQYVAIMVATGYLTNARKALATMTVPAEAPPAFGARIEARRGELADASGQYLQASDHFDKALALVPGDLDVSLQRVRALLKANRFGDAETILTSLGHTHPKAPEVLLAQIEVALAGGEVDRAAEGLEAAQTALSTDPRVPYLAGQLHAMKLEVEQAQKMFATARERDPKFFAASIAEAELLAKIKEQTAALALLEEARTAAETDGRVRDAATLLVARARLQLGVAKRADAIASLSSALALVPSDNEAQLRRGLAQIDAGQTAEGEADLIAVFERAGTYPGLARPLGMIYLRGNRIAELDTLIGEQLQGETTPDDLVMLGARLRLQQNRPADAKPLIEIGLARNPSDWEGYMLLSEVNLREHDDEGALRAVEKAQPLAPQAELYLQRARVLEFNERHDDARPLYLEATKLDPGMHEARFLYGRALEKSGEYAGAIKQLTAVVEAEDAKESVWYAEAWQSLGLAQSKVGETARSIASLKQATTINENLGESFAELGTIYERDNKHGPAMAALDKAIELGPTDSRWYADALMNLGRAQSGSGRTAQSKETFARFLEIAPPEHTGRPEARRLSGL